MLIHGTKITEPVAYSIGVASCTGGPRTIPVLVVEAAVAAWSTLTTTQVYTSITLTATQVYTSVVQVLDASLRERAHGTYRRLILGSIF